MSEMRQRERRRGSRLCRGLHWCTEATGPRAREQLRTWVPRLLGVALLPVLLAQLDFAQVRNVVQHARWPAILVAIAAVVPLILVKTVRWQGILGSQSVPSRTWPAFLAYLSSVFLGLLTPSRLGEFVRAGYVAHDCGTPLGVALAGVLADRLFDLYALLLVGSLAALSLTTSSASIAALAGVLLVLSLPLVIFLHDTAFRWFRRTGLRSGRLGQRLLAQDGLLVMMRLGLRCLTCRPLLQAASLTALAYGIFFGQCYLLARAIGLPVGPVTISVAVALGSLVTLLPISISGLGTREAAIVAYLGTSGVPPESALAFSLLIFLTFYLGGGLLGAVAWWLKPVPLGGL